VAPTQSAMGFPAIPGVPLPDGILTQLFQFDLDTNSITTTCRASSPCSHAYPPDSAHRRARVDGDGNEVAGVASVLQPVSIGHLYRLEYQR